MTTRNGSRVYRRAPKPLGEGACPHCSKVIVVTASGRRRAHTADGVMCTGSGVMVGQADVCLDPDAVIAAWDNALVEDRWKDRDRSGPANPWSGKP